MIGADWIATGQTAYGGEAFDTRHGLAQVEHRNGQPVRQGEETTDDAIGLIELMMIGTDSAKKDRFVTVVARVTAARLRRITDMTEAGQAMQRLAANHHGGK
jgi:hypothetical protein